MAPGKSVTFRDFVDFMQRGMNRMKYQKHLVLGKALPTFQTLLSCSHLKSHGAWLGCVLTCTLLTKQGWRSTCSCMCVMIPQPLASSPFRVSPTLFCQDGAGARQQVPTEEFFEIFIEA